ncbi:hypothetical protein FSP39_008942 [Pinctada imbricata]|uniref:Rhodanese domain-containing protein n=1 Tax=Pinctada imbricata TaxID=66713 RepID=A0AA89BQW0_PINIB|nr:hypothetical protein FSP39_008942 [Pinctada imbricata]
MEADHNEMFPRNLPDPEIFQSRVRDIGVNDNSHLVLYSNSDMSGFFMSGRAWLTFKHFGPDELKVSILDGGLQKWIAENRPTKSTKDEEEQGKPKVEPGNFTRKENDTYVMKYDKMVDVANSNSKQICDSRPNAKYQDKTGHIKGAANLPLSQLLENGVLKSVDSIKEEFQSVGVDITKPLVTYCASGMSSSSLCFAAMLCKNPDVSVYHGGFTEWSKRADPDLISKSSPDS